MIATKQSPNTLSGILDRIDATWRDWMLALEAVDPARREESGVCGYWSVKDIMAHIALWENEIEEHLQRWALGLPKADVDVDAMNAAVVAENKDRPYPLVRIDMHRAHHAAITAIRGITSELDDDVRDRIACETWDHFPEHTEQIRQWTSKESNS
ncbi:MAG TPA: hypothetical protein VFI12_02795 [Thermomicrobiales bacterium]|nr:hypothetical protein [Thermomicrobiales bacterium]